MFYYAVPAADRAPGYCLVTDHFLCVVGGDATHEYLMSLWEVLQADGSRLEDVLSFFAANGIAQLPGFALVELVDVPTGSVVLAVRGEAQVEILGRESAPYVGAGAATWVEGAAQSVDRLSIGFRGAPVDGIELPLHRGIVRSDRLVWRTHPDHTEGASEKSSSDLDVDDELTEIPAWARTPESDSANVTATVTAAIDRSAFALDEEDDHTIVMSARRAPATPDEFDETVVSPSRPRAGSSQQSPLILTMPDGTSIDLSTPIIVGRKPKSPLNAPANVRLVSVSSPTNEVSSTHVEFSLHNDAVLVRDSQSTNGSIIRVPDTEPYLLKSGESVSVPVGTAIDLGDSNLVTVARRT